MSTMPLSFIATPDEALATFQRDGYFLEPELFSQAEVATIRDASTALARFRDGSLLPAMNPHLEDAFFQKIAAMPNLVEIVSRLIGGVPLGLQTEYFFMRPGAKGFAAHQDNFYVDAPVGSFVSAWLAIDDVDVENGALSLYPGTHKLGIFPVHDTGQIAPFGQDPNATRLACEIPEGYDPISVPVPAGSVVFLDGAVAHGSSDNITVDRTRQALLMTFIREGVPFNPGRFAKRKTFALT